MSQYNESLVLKEIARNIGDYFKKASNNLDYSKGYKGIITGVQSDYYIVRINGIEHKLRTDWPLTIGQSVNLISMQNNMNDLVIIPSYKMITGGEN